MLDFYDDSTGAILREILTEHAETVPDCVVKSANLVPSEAFREEKTAFAWPAQGRFALDTPEDAWLSARYFEKVAHKIPFQHHERISGAIEQALLVHGFGQVTEKVAAVVEHPREEDYALVVKSASGNEYGVVLEYPVNTKQAAAESIAWYPRGLNGEFSGHRPKVAAILIAKAEEFGLGITEVLSDDTRPIKASSLIQELGQRVQRIHLQNQEATRTGGLNIKAARLGVTMPYEVNVTSAIDPRFIRAYEELVKQARKEPLPSAFFGNMAELDKHAGLDLEGLSPASLLESREIDYDVMPAITKLAGTYVSIDELMEKVSKETWADLAPHLIDDIYNPIKLAAGIEHLPLQTQKILLTKTRGF